jgi:hypothetical protein
MGQLVQGGLDSIDTRFEMVCELADGALQFASTRIDFGAQRARLAVRDPGTSVPPGTAGPATLVVFDKIEAGAGELSHICSMPDHRSRPV